LISADEVGS